MLIKLINLISGYVIFTFTGGFADKFINLCYEENINIKNIIYSEKALTARCSINSYKKLRKIAQKSGGRLRIIKKRGLPFILHPLKDRWGVFAGLLLFVFMTSFLTGYIWNITVIGNDTLQQAAIVDFLAKNGFKTGARWAQTDKENLEFAVMAEFDEVAWISINKLGCLAQVEIREAVKQPEVEDDRKITNVIAKKDGVIVSVTALGGWEAVKEGEAVTKGDLLISGVYEPKDEYQVLQKNHYAHAHGTVMAKTDATITVNVPREQSIKTTTDEKEFKSFYFYGIEIPLFINDKRENYQIDYSKTYLVVDGFRLPIGIFTEKRSYYSTEKESASDEALETLAAAQLEERKKEELKNCEILGENIDTEITQSGITITASYSLLEDIGEEKEIIFSNEKAEDKEE